MPNPRIVSGSTTASETVAYAKTRWASMIRSSLPGQAGERGYGDIEHDVEPTLKDVSVPLT